MGLIHSWPIRSENLSGKAKKKKKQKNKKRRKKTEGNFGAIEGNLKVYCGGSTHRYN